MAEIGNNTGKLLMILGVVLLLAGLFLTYGNKIPLLSKLGSLPLDIKIEKENFKFYFPLGTSILLSILFSLALKFFGGSAK